MTSTTNKLDRRSIRLEVDDLTRVRYERCRHNFANVAQSEGRLAELAPDGEYISRDIFAGLYSPGSVVDPSTDGTPIRQLTDWVVGQLENMPEWRRLARASRNNVASAAYATSLVNQHLSTLDWPKLPEPDTEDEGGESNSATYRRDNAGRPETLTISVVNDGNGFQLQTQKSVNGRVSTSARMFADEASAIQAKEKAMAKAEAAGYDSQDTQGAEGNGQSLAEFVESVVSNGMGLPSSLTQQVEKSAQNAELADRLFSACGLNGDEPLSASSDDGFLKAATKLMENKDFQKFLRLVGSFLDSMQESKNRQRTRGHIMPYNIETTRDLRRLLPSELAMLSSAELRGLQTLRIMSGHALGWSMNDVGSKERGPMFVALDTSGSMDGMIQEAKAFCVAAALQAADDNREVCVATFNTRLGRMFNSLSTPGDRLEFLKAMNEVQAYGGTSFIDVVARASELSANSDVLLISDGVGEIDQETTVETFKTRSLHYLVVGDEYSSVPLLKELAGSRMRTVKEIDGNAVEFAASAL